MSGMDLFFSSAPNQKARYSEYHIWKTYKTLMDVGPISRKKLSDELEIGEGSTRSILERMIKEGHVEVTKKGAALRDEGRKRFEELDFICKHLEHGFLYPGKFSCVLLLRKMARMIEGYLQEDRIINYDGVTINFAYFLNGQIKLYGKNTQISEDKISTLYDLFALDEEDLLVMASAENLGEAEREAVIRALALTNLTSRCWEDGVGIVEKGTEKLELRCYTLIVHELMGRLPVTMRYKNKSGVRCEGGRIIDSNYTGPVLEEALDKGKILRKVAPSGPYKGVPIIAVPIKRMGEIVGVIGVVDITKGAVFDILNKM